jgi:hypothetical protein
MYAQSSRDAVKKKVLSVVWASIILIFITPVKNANARFATEKEVFAFVIKEYS